MSSSWAVLTAGPVPSEQRPVCAGEGVQDTLFFFSFSLLWLNGIVIDRLHLLTLQLALNQLNFKSPLSALYKTARHPAADFGSEVKDISNKDDRKGGCSDAASFHPCLNPELLRSTLAHMPSFSSVSILSVHCKMPQLCLLVTYKGCVLFTVFLVIGSWSKSHISLHGRSHFVGKLGTGRRWLCNCHSLPCIPSWLWLARMSWSSDPFVIQMF